MNETTIFDVSFNLTSAVCLSTGRVAGNITHTIEYISGSTLRGALAEAYLSRNNRTADGVFEQLFLSGEISYGNLYPRQEAGESFPLPLSAHSCKHKEGFQQTDPDEHDDNHGVVELLLDVAEYAIKSKQGISMDTRRQDECLECGAPLEPFTGFYEQTLAGNYHKVKLPKRVITRSATDDRTHTAERGQLYSLEVLETPDDASTAFGGEIICSKPEAATLFEQHLSPIIENHSLFVGTAKSRGLGEIKTQELGGISQYAWQECRTPLKGEISGENSDQEEGRFVAFQRAVVERGIADGRLYFSVTLFSDAILQDEYFCCLPSLTAERLAWEAGLPTENLERIEYFTSTRQISGWNAALRCPKPQLTAIVKSSSFLFAALGVDEAQLLTKLSALERRGVGERRAEGFGRIVICDPFHTKREVL